MSYCWIANRKVAGTGDLTEIHSPWSGELLASFHQASSGQIDQAIGLAANAFAECAKLPLYQRHDMLARVAKLIEEYSDKMIKAIVSEAAKPVKDARAEVSRAVATFRLAARETIKTGDGEYLILDNTPAAHGRSAIVRRFPRGAALGITPFNFPLNLVAHKVSPALACGCPIVLKPAPQAPTPALILAELIAEAGFPAGAMQVVLSDGTTIEPFVSDSRIKFVTFTGSAAVGWKLRKLTTVPVTLELGGNGAVIIDETADLEHAAKRCTVGGYAYAGQVCISVQRIYVVEEVFEKFIALMQDNVGKLVLGDPTLETTDLSAMISIPAAQRVEEWIDEAIQTGADPLVRGTRNQNRLTPSLLSNVSKYCRLMQEEVFGPVVAVSPVKDWMVGLNEINDSKYGLQAGYFTKENNRIMSAFERLEVGGVIANDVPTFREDSYPYGGIKESGIGREGVRYAMEEMTEKKVLVLPPNN